MNQIGYASIQTGPEGRAELVDQIESVDDLRGLGPWKFYSETLGERIYVFNNTMSDDRPPLMLTVENRSVSIYTTAYGEPSFHGKAHKVMLVEDEEVDAESAVEYIRGQFEIKR